jgi:hypothetical protein
MGKLSPRTEAAVKAAVAAYPERWTHGICAFTMYDPELGDDANVRNAQTGDVCHAGLTPWGDRKGKDVIVINAHKASWQKKHREYLLWCCKEAPFTHGVLNRDNDDELLNHACVMDTRDIGRGGALWLCKAVRHFTEDAHVINTWEKLREHGLNGLQAFIGADILNEEGTPKPHTTHTGLYGYTDPAGLRKWYDEIRRKKCIREYNVAESGQYGAARWGSLKGKKVKKPDGWGGFLEKFVPCEAKEYAAQLKEIFEGDPKNVG